MGTSGSAAPLSSSIGRMPLSQVKTESREKPFPMSGFGLSATMTRAEQTESSAANMGSRRHLTRGTS